MEVMACDRDIKPATIRLEKELACLATCNAATAEATASTTLLSWQVICRPGVVLTRITLGVATNGGRNSLIAKNFAATRSAEGPEDEAGNHHKRPAPALTW
jgi:hypothetical protein